MRKSTALVLIPLLALGAWSGCAFKQKKVEKEVEAELKSPAAINCATADGDVRLLQHEKAHVAQRIAEGVTAIYPASLVVGLISGTETTKVKVAVGEYNKLIDRRIAEIKQACPVE
jgi:hypothetical protein